ncbi:MAG TPA: N-6 DNA methylase [Planctomycetaceae bacterium]|nr:N-6 DNA methylase [Planctomycetaceae bacterium]
MTKVASIKANGAHYTPPELASFLAAAAVEQLGGTVPMRVLDPACGDGELLLALAEGLPAGARAGLQLVGYETDRSALVRAGRRLKSAGVADVELYNDDFLMLDRFAARGAQRNLFGEAADPSGDRCDVVIANPPYVRTQILGKERSQSLARRFELTGRVDLYHAFVAAICDVLRPGGVLALLTSNRFMTINSGASLRKVLRTAFDLQSIYDLGDTKLFNAAVLPVIVVGRKRGAGSAPDGCQFHRVYEHRTGAGDVSAIRRTRVLEALQDGSVRGVVQTSEGTYLIERGRLSPGSAADVWSISTPEYDRWLHAVRSRQTACFEDVAHVRVGIKTTADDVFIRDSFAGVPIERGLVRPLITHRDAGRWFAVHPGGSKQVLYPHETVQGVRRRVGLDRHPKLQAYLESHGERLRRRRYVVDSGREWYEIWVPHNPDDWGRPKLVLPDIAETPRCFFDETGAVVNGDCYWMTLRARVDPSLLRLMLAIANSTFITRYYDIAFHNKLYAGRRRFMTQYVRRFPLPDPQSPPAREIVRLVDRVLKQQNVAPDDEEQLDTLVWRAFGLVKQ